MVTKEKTADFRSNKGFSLIEIMVVLVILGVLIAIAIPVFSNNMSQAEDIVCKSNQYQLRNAEEAHFLLHGEHSLEYINHSTIPENSTILQFFNEKVSVKCPDDGGYYYWAERDGETMIFCSEHGSDNPPVIDVPPPVPATLQLYEELAQNYTDDALVYIVYSASRQDVTMGADNIIGTDQNDNIRTRAGNDLIDAGAGNDKIQGNNGNDGLFGGEGDDNLNGGSGDDYLSGGPGNDTINGGNNFDTVVYDKDISAYEIVEYRTNRFYITDLETGEVDNVLNVESFQFGDNEPVARDDL